MILYFTGTGNSEYAAKKLAAALGEETMPLMERIRHNDTSPLESETPWIVCTPTYAWQLPHIVRDHLRRTLLRGSKEIYFVMTCGGEIGKIRRRALRGEASHVPRLRPRHHAGKLYCDV